MHKPFIPTQEVDKTKPPIKSRKHFTDSLVELLEDYCENCDDYINPYLLKEIVESLSGCYNIEVSGKVDAWISNMWSR